MRIIPLYITIYYIYAVIGMEAFHSIYNPNNPKNVPIFNFNLGNFTDFQGTLIMLVMVNVESGYLIFY